MATISASRPPVSRLPRDYGMTSLGLLMQALGGLFIAFNAVLLIPAFTFGGGAGGTGILYFLGIVVSGMVRSSMHYSAGQKLSTSTPDALLAAKRYAIFGIVQSAAVVALGLVLIPGGSPSGGTILWLLFILAVWPVTVLLVISRPGLREAFDAAYEGDRPVWPRDRGLQGAGVLMTALGLLGTILSVTIVIAIVPQMGGLIKAGFVGIMTLALVVVLTVRAFVHFTGGLVGLRTNYVDFITSINRYFTWAVISVSVLVVASFTAMAQFGGIQGLFSIALMAAALLIWPAALNSLAKRIPWDMDDVGAPNGPAVDGGLSALGFLILLVGIYGAMSIGFAVIVAGSSGPLSGAFSEFMQDSGDMSLWLAAGVTGVTIWAGLEMALMTERFKLAGTAYGLIGITVALYSTYNMVAGGGLGASGPQVLVAVAGNVGVSLALPIVALWLANRPLPTVTDYSSVFE